MPHRAADSSVPHSAPRASEPAPQRFDRYEVLIKVAAEIFRANGYDGTSLQQIADEVGLLKGSLYHYIKTKEDLLYAIIKRNHDHVIAENSAWREADKDPLEAIRLFIHGHVRATLENPTFAEVFVRDFRSLSSERAEEIRMTQAEYAQNFRTLIERAIESKHLRAGVESHFATRAVFGMANSVSAWYSPQGQLSPDEIAEKLSDYALASLMTPAGSANY